MNGELTEEQKEILREIEENNRIANKAIKKKRIVILIVVLILSFFGFLFGYENYFRPVSINENIDKNSIHYATDLYYSDGRYYDEYLNDVEKKLYLVVFNDIKDLKTVSNIYFNEYGYSSYYDCYTALSKIFDIIYMEHPDLFWYRYSSYEVEDNYLVVDHHYVTRNKLRLYFVEKRLLRKLDEIVTSLDGLSDYEKVKGVYEWLGTNTSYSSLMTWKDGTAWSALLESDTVCAGYATASQLLFQRMGINSMLVTGNTTGAHAWNFVELDDGYYWYDATVGGSVGSDSSYFYKGLLFSDSSGYSVNVVNLSNYTFGTKYLDQA